MFYVLFIMGDKRARRKSPPTETEKKWISCDSTISTNTNNSRTIQDMHQIASPINILGKQTGDLEKVITFISTLIEEGIKNLIRIRIIWLAGTRMRQVMRQQKDYLKKTYM